MYNLPIFFVNYFFSLFVKEVQELLFTQHWNMVVFYVFFLGVIFMMLRWRFWVVWGKIMKIVLSVIFLSILNLHFFSTIGSQKKFCNCLSKVWIYPCKMPNPVLLELDIKMVVVKWTLIYSHPPILIFFLYVLPLSNTSKMVWDMFIFFISWLMTTVSFI